MKGTSYVKTNKLGYTDSPLSSYRELIISSIPPRELQLLLTFPLSEGYDDAKTGIIGSDSSDSNIINNLLSKNGENSRLLLNSTGNLGTLIKVPPYH